MSVKETCSRLSANLLRKIPDEMYVKLKYRVKMGKKLNLENPVTFSEKIQWLKINACNPLYTQLVDKYEVRKFVAEKIGEEHLIPLVGGPWERVEDIEFDKLPKQFVIKCNHDSGGLVICDDKEKLDLDDVKKKLTSALKSDYYLRSREWPYRDVKRKIIAEKYMVDESEVELKDYKLFVFAGKVHYIEVDYNRYISHHRNFYSTDWTYVPFTTNYPTNPDYVIEKPKCLDEMIRCAEYLTKEAGNPPFLRVDFYQAFECLANLIG